VFEDVRVPWFSKKFGLACGSTVCYIAVFASMVFALVLVNLTPGPAVFKPGAMDASARMPFLFVYVHAPDPRLEIISMDVGDDWSVAAVKAEVARRIGVPAQYVELYKRRASVDTHSRYNRRLPGDRLTAVGINVTDADAAGAAKAAAAAHEAQPMSSFGVVRGAALDALIRPLRGDHIHIAFAVYIDGRRVSPVPDRPLTGNTSELGHVTNVFPHFGVHTGGPGYWDDGVIHVHPGTAWQWLTATEGLGCVLGAYLEQVRDRAVKGQSNAACVL
jgi:hypothetical protein